MVTILFSLIRTLSSSIRNWSDIQLFSTKLYWFYYSANFNKKEYVKTLKQIKEK